MLKLIKLKDNMMKQKIKAGLLALSTVFATQASAQEYTTIDLTELDGFTEAVGDKLQYGNEDFDLTTVQFFEFDTSRKINDRLPTLMCVDANRDGGITSNEDYRFNVTYASMVYSVKGEQGIFEVNGAVAAKRMMTEIEGMQWAVFENNGGEPVAIAVNTDQGLMISATVSDFPRDGNDQIRTPFGPCDSGMYGPR